MSDEPLWRRYRRFVRPDPRRDVDEGSLYPALHRLENKGLVEPHWGVSENNRQAKYYALTADGRQTLRAESESWIQYSAAITKVVTATRQQPA